mmetsp:Transcript_28231/g.72559  ORF Transcript_28231/g.72559 Transcript_28231/m.72559 type:complete len:268 (-) Transcript_28231:32-835(-)
MVRPPHLMPVTFSRTCWLTSGVNSCYVQIVTSISKLEWGSGLSSLAFTSLRAMPPLIPIPTGRSATKGARAGWVRCSPGIDSCSAMILTGRCTSGLRTGIASCDWNRTLVDTPRKKSMIADQAERGPVMEGVSNTAPQTSSIAKRASRATATPMKMAPHSRTPHTGLLPWTGSSPSVSATCSSVLLGGGSGPVCLASTANVLSAIHISTAAAVAAGGRMPIVDERRLAASRLPATRNPTKLPEVIVSTSTCTLQRGGRLSLLVTRTP